MPVSSIHPLFPLSSHALSYDVCHFPNDFNDSSVLNLLRGHHSGTFYGEKATFPMLASSKQGITSATVYVCLSLVLSESSTINPTSQEPVRHRPRSSATLIPILSAQMPTFSSTGTQNTRHSSCLMPKQMTNHVRIWPVFMALTFDL